MNVTNQDPARARLRRIACTAATLLAIQTGTACAKIPRLAGNWARTDGATRISIAPCGKDFCAKNTWVRNPDGPEKLGDRLILNVHPHGADRLTGQAYDVRRKLSYSMTIKFSGRNMQTSGCVLLGFICKTAHWRRAD